MQMKLYLLLALFAWACRASLNSISLPNYNFTLREEYPVAERQNQRFIFALLPLDGGNVIGVLWVADNQVRGRCLHRASRTFLGDVQDMTEVLSMSPDDMAATSLPDGRGMILFAPREPYNLVRIIILPNCTVESTLVLFSSSTFVGRPRKPVAIVMEDETLVYGYTGKIYTSTVGETGIEFDENIGIAGGVNGSEFMVGALTEATGLRLGIFDANGQTKLDQYIPAPLIRFLYCYTFPTFLVGKESFTVLYRYEVNTSCFAAGIHFLRNGTVVWRENLDISDYNDGWSYQNSADVMRLPDETYLMSWSKDVTSSYWIVMSAEGRPIGNSLRFDEEQHKVILLDKNGTLAVASHSQRPSEIGNIRLRIYEPRETIILDAPSAPPDVAAAQVGAGVIIAASVGFFLVTSPNAGIVPTDSVALLFIRYLQRTVGILFHKEARESFHVAVEAVKFINLDFSSPDSSPSFWPNFLAVVGLVILAAVLLSVWVVWPRFLGSDGRVGIGFLCITRNMCLLLTQLLWMPIVYRLGLLFTLLDEKTHAGAYVYIAVMILMVAATVGAMAYALESFSVFEEFRAKRQNSLSWLNTWKSLLPKKVSLCKGEDTAQCRCSLHGWLRKIAPCQSDGKAAAVDAQAIMLNNYGLLFAHVDNYTSNRVREIICHRFLLVELAYDATCVLLAAWTWSWHGAFLLLLSWHVAYVALIVAVLPYKTRYRLWEYGFFFIKLLLLSCFLLSFSTALFWIIILVPILFDTILISEALSRLLDRNDARKESSSASSIEVLNTT